MYAPQTLMQKANGHWHLLTENMENMESPQRFINICARAVTPMLCMDVIVQSTQQN
jgi:hypothetical protein